VLAQQREHRVARGEQEHGHGHQRRVDDRQQRRGDQRDPEPDSALYERSEHHDQPGERERHTSTVVLHLSTNH
jgi:hypothetical protein